MSIFELFLTACGLSMDAFAVSVTNGLCVRKVRVRGALMCGIIFGLFQGIMPAIGYALGMNFAEYIERFDHWIALILLGFIGLNMICGSGDDEIQTVGRLTFWAVLVQGFATSVDALAVGISFAALGVGIVRSAAFICVVTAALSFCGFMLGNKFSGKLKSKARIVGGVILICIGLKIFAEQTIFA